MFNIDLFEYRFEELTPKINETKLVTDMLWKAYEYTDDLVPLMEFTNEQLGAASKEIFTGATCHRLTSNPCSGSVSMTEEIIEKHLKVMDKIDKKKKDVKDIIMKGEKLADMAKAPVRRVDQIGSDQSCRPSWERS